MSGTIGCPQTLRGENLLQQFDVEFEGNRASDVPSSLMEAALRQFEGKRRGGIYEEIQSRQFWLFDDHFQASSGSLSSGQSPLKAILFQDCAPCSNVLHNSRVGNDALRFALHSDEITLGQLLKAASVVGSGGEVKPFLARGGCLVNGEEDNRRGRKLRVGDSVRLPGGMEIVLV